MVMLNITYIDGTKENYYLMHITLAFCSRLFVSVR